MLVVIPGGLTSYLQAGDIGIFKEFKDHMSVEINSWKNSKDIEYTKGGNPKPPCFKRVNMRVKNAWEALSLNNVVNSIQSAGFSNNSTNWHISKHEIYGDLFNEKFVESQKLKCVNEFIEIHEELDIYDLDDE